MRTAHANNDVVAANSNVEIATVWFERNNGHARAPYRQWQECIRNPFALFLANGGHAATTRL